MRRPTSLDEWHHFRSKARAAVLGDVVWPDKVGSRAVPADAQVEAIELRERLLRALEGGARTAAPVDTAAAQVNFDCWLEELEATKDPDAASATARRASSPRWPRPRAR